MLDKLSASDDETELRAKPSMPSLLGKRRLEVTLVLAAGHQSVTFDGSDGEGAPWTVAEAISQLQLSQCDPAVHLVAPKRQRRDGQSENRLPGEVITDGKICLVDRQVQREHPDGVEFLGRPKNLQPFPSAMYQDVVSGGAVVNICELADNALSAVLPSAQSTGSQEPTIIIELGMEEDEMDSLTFFDNGHGMAKDIAESCVQLAKSFSIPPNIVRSAMPLVLSNYISNQFSRYGRGMASTIYFGGKVKVLSRVAGAHEAYGVVFDYELWRKSENSSGTAPEAWVGTTIKSVPTGSGWPESFTKVIITKLRPEVLELLKNTNVQATLIKEIAATYYFHIGGMPECISSMLPSVIRGQQRSTHGGVKLRIFGQDLSQFGSDQVSTHTTPTHISRLLDRYDLLQKEHGRQLRPFVAAFRWVPKSKQGAVCDIGQHAGSSDTSTPVLDEAEDAEAEVYWMNLSRAAKGLPDITPARVASAAFAADVQEPMSKRRGRNGRNAVTPGTTPASALGSQNQAAPSSSKTLWLGSPESEAARDKSDPIALREHINTGAQIQQTFVDFLLILLYFPEKDGNLTKPDPSQGALPLWCGRLMPFDSLNKMLPALVRAARERGQKNQTPGWTHLDQARVGGLVFVSPDCKAGRTKDLIKDAAMEAFKNLGAHLSEGIKIDAESESEGTMTCFDLDSNSFRADPTGQFPVSMLLEHFSRSWRHCDDDGSLIDPTVDTDGVKISTQYRTPASSKYKQLSKGDLVRLLNRTEDEAQAGTKAAPGLNLASKHLVVQGFRQLGDTGNVQVVLRPWRPDWAPEAGLLRESVLTVRPVEDNEKLRPAAQANKINAWLVEAPHHLAFSRGGLEKGKKKGTCNPNLAAGLSAYPGGMRIRLGGLPQLSLEVVTMDDTPYTARSSFNTTAVTCQAEATMYSVKNEHQKKLWVKTFKLQADGHTIHILGREWDTAMNTLGQYRLEVQPKQKDRWFPMDAGLVYNFEVVDDEAVSVDYQLEASWGLKASLNPTVRVGMELPPILLTFKQLGRKPQPQALPFDVSLFQVMVTSEPEREGGFAATEQTILLTSATQGWTLESLGIGKALLKGCKLPHTVMVTFMTPQPVAATLSASLRVSVFDASAATQLSVLPNRKASSKGHPCELVVAETAPLTFTATGGMPCTWSLPRGLEDKSFDISKGAPLTKGGLSVCLVDKYGISFHMEPSKSKNGPCALVTLDAGLCSRKSSGKVLRLKLSADGVLELEEDSFYGSGVMGNKYRIIVALDNTSLPEGLRPQKSVEYTFHMEISRNSMSFFHTSIPTNPCADAASDPRTAAVLLPGATKGKLSGVLAAWQLDLLPRCIELHSCMLEPITTTPNINQWDQLHDLAEGLQALREDVYMRPNGTVYRGAQWRKWAVEVATKAAISHIDECVLVVGPLCTTISAIRIQLCEYATDSVDESFCAPFSVLLDNNESVYPGGAMKGASQVGHLSGMQVAQPDELYLLDPIDLRHRVLSQWQAGRHTVPIKVTDSDDPAAVIGTFYLRQAPHPASVCLLPTAPLFLQQLALGSLLFDVQLAASVADSCSLGWQLKKELKKCKLRPSEGWKAKLPSLGPAHGSNSSSCEPLLQAGEQGGVPPQWAGRDWIADTPSSVDLDLVHDRLRQITPLQVFAQQPFQVHFILLDQFGVPMRASPHVRQFLAAHAQATSVLPVKGKTSRTFPVDILPGSWKWDLGCSSESRGLPNDLPVHAVSLRVSPVQGEATPTMEVNLSCTSLGAVHHALVTADLQLNLKVQLSPTLVGPMAPDGLQLIKPNRVPAEFALDACSLISNLPCLAGEEAQATCVRISPDLDPDQPLEISRDGLRSLAALEAAGVPSNSRPYKLDLPEDCTVELSLKMLDKHGQMVLKKGAVVALLPGWAGASGLTAEILQPDSKWRKLLRLKLAVPRGVVSACICPQLLLLSMPVNDQTKQACPILLELIIHQGSYPAQLLPLLHAEHEWPVGVQNWSGQDPKVAQDLKALHATWEQTASRQTGPMLHLRLDNSRSDTDMVLPLFRVAALTSKGLVAALDAKNMQSIKMSWEFQEAALDLPPHLAPQAPVWAPWTELPLPDAPCQTLLKIPHPMRPGVYRLQLSTTGVTPIHLGPFEVVPGLPHHLGTMLHVQQDQQPLHGGIFVAWNIPDQMQCVTLEKLKEAEAGVWFSEQQLQVFDSRGNPCCAKESLVATFKLQLQQMASDLSPVDIEYVPTGVWEHEEHLSESQLLTAYPPPLNLAPDALTCGAEYQLVAQAWLRPTSSCQDPGATTPGSPPSGRNIVELLPWRLAQFMVLSKDAQTLQELAQHLKLLERLYQDQLDAAVAAAATSQAALIEAEDQTVHLERQLELVKATLAAAPEEPPFLPLEDMGSVVVFQADSLPEEEEDGEGEEEGDDEAVAPPGGDAEEEGARGESAQRTMETADTFSASAARRHRLYAPLNMTSDQQATVRRIMQTLQARSIKGVLGPVCMLLRCECVQVARTLSAFLGSSQLRMWVVLDRQARDGLHQVLLEQGTSQYKVLTLSLGPETVERFTLNPVLSVEEQGGAAHPQAPLAMGGQPLAMQSRFVGFATNLVHLPLGLVRLRVHSCGAADPFSLRQSLCHALFGRLLVFETTSDMHNYLEELRAMPESSDRLHRDLRCVSLDGGVANILPGEEGWGWLHPLESITLGGLASAEQLYAPFLLDLRIRAMQVKRQAHAQLGVQHQMLEDNLIAARQMLEAAEHMALESAEQAKALQGEVGPQLSETKYERDQTEQQLRLSLRSTAQPFPQS